MAKKTTLRTPKINEQGEKEYEYIYPQTLADIVHLEDGTSVEEKIRELEENSGGGFEEIVGTEETPIVLADLEPGMYNIIGVYKPYQSYYITNNITSTKSIIVTTSGSYKMFFMIGSYWSSWQIYDYKDNISLLVMFEGGSGNWQIQDTMTPVDERDVLKKTNNLSYSPANDYNPATKKYVDDTVAAAITGVLEGEV